MCYLWCKRFLDIQKGNAILSIRQWSGAPRRSKQVEIDRLSSADGIGLQCLTFQNNDFHAFTIDGKSFEVSKESVEALAANDGLILKDWEDWFKGYDLSKPMAVIHFNKFRY